MSNIKKGRLHFAFAFLIQLGILGVCMFAHRTSIALGENIMASDTVYGQATKPTLGRFIFMLAAFVLFLLFTYLAEKFAKRGFVYPPFILGTFAGTFLWQAIGEDAWNFAIDGVHMVSLESIAAFPLAILFVLFFFYIRIGNRVGWGEWSMVMAFGVNWMGHYVLECSVIPFESFVDPHIFTLAVGCGLGALLFVLGLLLGLKKDRNVKERFEMSVLCYFAMALIAFSIMEA